MRHLISSLPKQAVFVQRALWFLIGCVTVLGIYSARAVYADGSFVLYELLARHDFFVFDTPRAYAQYAMQWPVVLAIRCGVTDLNLLIRLFSVGLIAFPALIWVTALFILRKSEIFWLLLLGFVVSYLRTNFFAAGEFNITNSLVAMSLALLAQKSLSLRDVLALLTISFVLIRSYESMLFFGPFLSFAAVNRFFSAGKDDLLTGILLWACSASLAYGGYLSAQSAFFIRSYDVDSTLNITAFKEFHLAYLVAIFLIAAALCLNINRAKKMALSMTGILVSVLYGVYLLRWENTGISYGYLSYAYRSHGAFLLMGILVLIWLTMIARVQHWFHVAIPQLSMVVACAFLIETGLLLKHSVGFYDWAKRFETTAIAADGFTPLDKTSVNTEGSVVSGYNWPWTNLTLSILMRGDASGGIRNATQFSRFEAVSLETIGPHPLKGFSKSSRLYR